MTDRAEFRVVLADSDANFRQLLGAVFASVGAKVVGETANAMESIWLSTRKMPNAVVLDTDLGILDLAVAIQEIKLRDPRVRVIVTAAQPHWRDKALRAGADAFIVKDDEGAQRVVAAAIV